MLVWFGYFLKELKKPRKDWRVIEGGTRCIEDGTEEYPLSLKVDVDSTFQFYLSFDKSDIEILKNYFNNLKEEEQEVLRMCLRYYRDEATTEDSGLAGLDRNSREAKVISKLLERLDKGDFANG